MSQEHPKPVELDHEIVAAFAQTFISRWDSYSLQNSDGRYVAIKQPLTIPMVEAHLRGERTLGAYALDSEAQAKWLCVDADEVAPWQGLIKLARSLSRKRIPSYLELSRRGGHLWLFVEPLSGHDARRFGKRLLADYHLQGFELYPKQEELLTGPGSLVRLPLGIHQKSGHRYHFITPDGAPLAPTIREQLAILAVPQKVPQAFVQAILRRALEEKRVFLTPRFTPMPKEAYGGKPSEKIKHAVSVYDFVGQFVELDSKGVGLCPFHDDHAQSFSVNQENNYWNCFAGCGGGSVIDFWQRWRKLHNQDDSFTATIAELAQMLLS